MHYHVAMKNRALPASLPRAVSLRESNSEVVIVGRLSLDVSWRWLVDGPAAGAIANRGD